MSLIDQYINETSYRRPRFIGDGFNKAGYDVEKTEVLPLVANI